MAELMQDIRHIPPWLIVAGVGGLGAVFLLIRRSGSNGAVVSTVPAASITATPDGSLQASGLAGGPALGGNGFQLSSLSTQPASGAAVAAPAGPSPFAGAFAAAEYNAYDTPENNAQASSIGDQLGGFTAQFGSDPGYAQWAAQEKAFAPGGSLQNNTAARQSWIAQGQQYLAHDKTAGGGSSERIVDILPHGYATEMTPGVIERWLDWLGGTPPHAGLSDTQRYVARTTHHELAARHKAATDDAINQLLGGV